MFRLGIGQASVPGAATPSSRSRYAARTAGVVAILGGGALAMGLLAQPATRSAAAGVVNAPVCATQHNLSNPTNSNHRVLDSYWFAVTDHGHTTAVCNLLNNVKAGDIVTAHFVLHTPGPVGGAEITLVSYNAAAPNPHSQTLFECASFGDTPGAGDPCTTSATASLTVTVPACGFQVDLIYDEPITPLVQGTYIKQHRFISGDQGRNPTCIPPSIATTPAPATTTLGQPVADTASVTPSTLTGMVTFSLFAANDPTCASAPIFTASTALAGGTATSTSFTPTSIGTYHWTAQMSSPVLSSPCADESVVVTAVPAAPAISTTQSAGGPVGTALSDTATVTGVTNPAGNVVFRLFGVGDTTCTGTPIATDTELINSAGHAATTQTITPQAQGKYEWTATFTGVTPNLVSTCGSEPVTIAGGVQGITGGGGGGVGGVTTPSTGAGGSLPAGALLVTVGLLILGGERRLRRHLS